MSAPVRPDLRVLFLLYMLEGCALLAGAAAYKAAPRTWLGSTAGRIGIGAVLVAAAALAGLVRERAKARRADPRRFRFTVGLNLLSVVLAFAVAEGAVRMLAVRERGDVYVLGTMLLPRSWPDVAAHWRGALGREGAFAGTYLVHDDGLGWTVGRDRAAGNGLYWSSVEGIRSGSPHESFRTAAEGRRRVAVVGDSFTFGMDVPHEATWAFHLGARLGPDFQVLNFGVDGYGVDQSYLRYLEDARPWRPEVVLLGAIHDDFGRATGVYAFLNRPMWGFPFARPRLALEAGEPRRLAAKAPSPEWIFSRERIDELPHLGHEPGYDEAQWNFRWHDRSFLVRFLKSRFPRWAAPDERAQRETTTLGTAILRAFLRDAAAQGSRALVLYFPVRGDFDERVRARLWSVPALLRAEGIPFEDLTECVRAVPAAERFVEGHGHYSPRTNEAVAEHLYRLLR